MENELEYLCTGYAVEIYWNVPESVYVLTLDGESRFTGKTTKEAIHEAYISRTSRER